MLRKFSLALSLALSLSACDQHESIQKSSSPASELQKKIEKLSNQLNADERLIHGLQSSQAIATIQLSGINDSPAWLDTDTHSYGIARNSFGAFPVMVEKVEPYLDGFKVTAQVGNITNTNFSGAKITLGWGNASKDFDIPATFISGRWTRVELVANPAKATDMKTLIIGVTFNLLQLGTSLN